jgi:hypothetical protein
MNPLMNKGTDRYFIYDIVHKYFAAKHINYEFHTEYNFAFCCEDSSSALSIYFNHTFLFTENQVHCNHRNRKILIHRRISLYNNAEAGKISEIVLEI